MGHCRGEIKARSGQWRVHKRRERDAVEFFDHTGYANSPCLFKAIRVRLMLAGGHPRGAHTSLRAPSTDTRLEEQLFDTLIADADMASTRGVIGQCAWTRPPQPMSLWLLNTALCRKMSRAITHERVCKKDMREADN
jgi:hypothetical protein